MSGRYGGATHRLSSVYEFDPMDFPGPLWIDVPYASADIHKSATFSGGAFGYQPQVDPGKFNELDVGNMGLPPSNLNSSIAATGASVPKWDINNTTNDGLGRTADLGGSISSADDLYYQVANSVDPASGDVVVAGPYTVSKTETFGTPETITQFKGSVTVPSGAQLRGDGALIVEGDLVVRGKMRWDGLVIVRSTEQALRVELKDTEIEGAFVVSQEAFPPGGHMDVTVYREPDGKVTAPYGRRAAGPGSLRPSPKGLDQPWPFWQHTHKFDYPETGDADYAARADREIRFVDQPAGDPQESYTGLRELLNHLGSERVYVEFDNAGESGHAIVEMEVDGFDAVRRGVSAGFTETALEGGSKRRSRAFEARELERLVIRPQSLRSLRKLWDSNGVCDGAVPAEWPMCVGYDRGNREGALTVRLRSADKKNAVLYEGAVYWHMQAGQEHDDYKADKAAWKAAVGSGATPFGTAFTMSSNSSMTYDLVPIAALAEKVGFAGNRVIHISTESELIEAVTARAAASGAGGTGGTGGAGTGSGTGGGNTEAPDIDPNAEYLMCDKKGTKSKYVKGEDVAKHQGHGCTLGACPSAPPPDGPATTTPDVVPPGETPPPAEAGDVSSRFKATSSQPMYAASSNQKVKVCTPDGFNDGEPEGSWNEAGMKFKEVEQFLRDNPYAIYGTCSDNSDWVNNWADD